MAQTRSNRQTLSRGAHSPRRETLSRVEEHRSTQEDQAPLIHGDQPPLIHGDQSPLIHRSPREGHPSLIHQQPPPPGPPQSLGVHIQVPPLTTSHALSGPYSGIPIPPMVPWAEYEALRNQHAEGIQALREMAGILQSLIPRGSIPATLRKFIPEAGPSRRVQQGIPETEPYGEITPEAPVRPIPPRND